MKNDSRRRFVSRVGAPARVILIVACGLFALSASSGQARAQQENAAEKKSDAAGAENWQAGLAVEKITPTESMWMAGYAARKKPSEGVRQDLYAKALALKDYQDNRLVIVTTDLIGIPRTLRDWLIEETGKRYDLPPQSLLLNASHTHCGPELRYSKASIYGIAPDRAKQSRAYYEDLQRKLLDLIGRALDDMQPGRLQYTQARAGFAMNRRLPTPTGIRNAPNREGPVDHEVPVLRVTSPDGKERALLFGYACHNTTLSFFEFCGDYAGYAQEYLEQARPGVVAMFVNGCSGDQNPQPRRTIELCQQHGRALANGVEAALISRLDPVRGPIAAAVDVATLEFATPPTREELAEQQKSTNQYERRHAQRLLDELNENGKIADTYPYLVQVVQFGNDLTMVALSGEVVVDYSLRLKAELAGPPVWVAGYSNDVMAYIPSRRVLLEGGYEGESSMRYTRFPGPWAPSIEQKIVGKVHELAGQVRGN